MDALDGNAIAGVLFEHFGEDMTMTRGKCGHCHTISRMGELSVYMRAPGAVARCPTCGKVVMVIVEIRGEARFDVGHMEMLHPA